MGDRTAESEAQTRQSVSKSSLTNPVGLAPSSGSGSRRVFSDEEFKRRIDELKKEHNALRVEIVPRKRGSWLYDSRKFQRLEADYGFPAGRMFAPGIIQFGFTFYGCSVTQVRDGLIVGPASKTQSVVIKTLDIAKESGIRDLPILLQEARAYEALTKLAGKCLPRFFGSGILGNQYALVIEKVPGRMLRTLSSQEKAECKDRVVKAYKALHAAGYVQ